VIAIAGPNLPHEVLIASGRGVAPLHYDPDREAPRASQWLETKFAPWAPPVIEAWLDGEYDAIEHVLFSRADDTSQRLYYYVCELQRRGELSGPEPRIFDVAKINRATSIDRNAVQVRELMQWLGVTEAALETAIVETNRRRAARPQEAATPVCLLAGTAPPDQRLHTVAAEAGYTLAGRTLPEDWMDLGEAVEESTGDPAQAQGRQLHARQSGPRSFADPAERLRREIAASGASAVVLWRIEEDEAQTWHLPAERRALDEIGVPSLVLTRRDWRCRDGVSEEIGEFLKGVAA
jgi:hypothetical protein